ncbi:MAG: thioredoxin-like domain-containing protein [Pirellulales bacterium]
MSAPTTFRRQFHRAALVALVALSGYLMVFGVSGDGLVDIGSFVSATDAGGSATRRLPTDSHRVQLVAARMQADGQDKPADDATTGGEKPGSDTESNGTATEENDMPQHPFPRRAPAPPLTGGEGWLNTAGPIELEALRGKFVVLDFWTYCCINCMHILPELKKLELAYPNEVVVIGVHSAKFDTEKGSDNIAEAVQRYEILHPVVNDSQHRIWNNFHITSWPSLRVIDPEGNLVAGASGEIDFETLDGFFQQALPYYRARGLLDETPMHFELESYAAADTPLRYPAKVLADEAGDRLFIADSNHNRIVVTSLAGELRYTIGSGAIGKNDGDFASATFNHPQGMGAGTERSMFATRKTTCSARSISTHSRLPRSPARESRLAAPGPASTSLRARCPSALSEAQVDAAEQPLGTLDSGRRAVHRHGRPASDLEHATRRFGDWSLRRQRPRGHRRRQAAPQPAVWSRLIVRSTQWPGVRRQTVVCSRQ